MTEDPVIELTEELARKKPGRSLLVVFVCLMDVLILFACLMKAINSSRGYGDTVPVCIFFSIVLALNIAAITMPFAPSYLSLRYHRKCLEEEKRIKELQNPRVTTGG